METLDTHVQRNWRMMLMAKGLNQQGAPAAGGMMNSFILNSLRVKGLNQQGMVHGE